jgi:hypothetical protein
MKYTIEGFNQKAAMNITAEKDGKTLKLDCTDLIILRFFVDFYPNMTKKIIDGKEYAWVNYQHILDDMPLLNIGKRSLMDRFKKLVDLKVLSHITYKENGTFSYYGFGENYSLLISDYEQECRETISEGMKNISQGMKNIAEGVKNIAYPCEENFIPPVKNSSQQNNPSTINNPSTKKSEKTTTKKGFDSILDDYTQNRKLRETLSDFIKMRKAKKKPMTDRALTMLLKKLDELSQNEDEKIRILEESILHTWDTVYPLKTYNTQPQNPQNNDYDEEMWGKMI